MSSQVHLRSAPSPQKRSKPCCFVSELTQKNSNRVKSAVSAKQTNNYWDLTYVIGNVKLGVRLSCPFATVFPHSRTLPKASGCGLTEGGPKLMADQVFAITGSARSHTSIRPMACTRIASPAVAGRVNLARKFDLCSAN